MINTFSSNRWIVWLSHAAMSTHLAFSRAQKARHISVPCHSLVPSHSDVARPRIDECKCRGVEGNEGEKTKREGRQRRTAAVGVARLMADALLASSATRLPGSRWKNEGALEREYNEEETRTLTKEQETRRRRSSHRHLVERAKKQRDAGGIWSCGAEGNANTSVESRAENVTSTKIWFPGSLSRDTRLFSHSKRAYPYMHCNLLARSNVICAILTR